MKKNTEIYTEKFVVIYRDEIKISKEEQEKKELNRSTMFKILQKIVKAETVIYNSTNFKIDYIEYRGFHANKFLEQSNGEFNLKKYTSLRLPISPDFSICLFQKPHIFSVWEGKNRIDHKEFKNRNMLIEKKIVEKNKKEHSIENEVKIREIKLEIEPKNNIGAIAIIYFVLEKE